MDGDCRDGARPLKKCRRVKALVIESLRAELGPFTAVWSHLRAAVVLTNAMGSRSSIHIISNARIWGSLFLQKDTW